ncbi:MAG: hypothetical protein U0790_14560 [Isosphaeraceae bacterium]
MTIRTRLAALLAVTLVSAGCTGNLRNRDRGVREPLQLPAAPKLEPTPPGSLGSSTKDGPLVAPLSAGAASEPRVLR